MLKKVSTILLILTWVDVLILSAFGLLSPVFAIFVVGQIEGGTASVVGFATAAYFVAKSLFQIPVGRYIDRHSGELDDFWIVIAGYAILASIPFFYLFAKTPFHIYTLQFFLGIADALAVPAYLAIFSRHLDKDFEGTEWSVRSVFTSVAAAIAGAAGGIIVDRFGFRALFVIAGVFALLSTLSLLFIKPFIYQERAKAIPPGLTQVGSPKTK
jgi:MFS family permease